MKANIPNYIAARLVGEHKAKSASILFGITFNEETYLLVYKFNESHSSSVYNHYVIQDIYKRKCYLTDDISVVRSIIRERLFGSLFEYGSSRNNIPINERQFFVKGRTKGKFDCNRVLNEYFMTVLSGDSEYLIIPEFQYIFRIDTVISLKNITSAWSYYLVPISPVPDIQSKESGVRNRYYYKPLDYYVDGNQYGYFYFPNNHLFGMKNTFLIEQLQYFIQREEFIYSYDNTTETPIYDTFYLSKYIQPSYQVSNMEIDYLLWLCDVTFSKVEFKSKDMIRKRLHSDTFRDALRLLQRKDRIHILNAEEPPSTLPEPPIVKE